MCNSCICFWRSVAIAMSASASSAGRVRSPAIRLKPNVNGAAIAADTIRIVLTSRSVLTLLSLTVDAFSRSVQKVMAVVGVVGLKSLLVVVGVIGG